VRINLDKLVFVDTETTSLRHDRRVWEVAIIREAPPVRQLGWHSCIGDVDLSMADARSLDIGRFYERHNSYALPEREIAQMVWADTEGKTLVGANPAFDAEGLAAMLRRHGLEPAWHHRLIDVESMALPLLGLGDDGRPRGLQALAVKLGIERHAHDAHTAWGDAELTRRVFLALAEHLPEVIA
jgi:DNA polymerase III epsilon subunit-like protein